VKTLARTHKRKPGGVAFCGDGRARVLHNWWAKVDCPDCLRGRDPDEADRTVLALALEEVARATMRRSEAGLDPEAGALGVDEELLALIEEAVDSDAAAAERSARILRRVEHLRRTGYKP